MTEVEKIEQEVRKKYNEMIECGRIRPGSLCSLVGISGCTNNSTKKRWCSKPCDALYKIIFKKEVEKDLNE